MLADLLDSVELVFVFLAPVNFDKLWVVLRLRRKAEKLKYLASLWMLAQFFVENARRGLHFEYFLVELVLLHVLEIVDVCRLFLLSVLISQMVFCTFFEFFEVCDPIDDDKAILILAHASRHFSELHMQLFMLEANLAIDHIHTV